MSVTSLNGTTWIIKDSPVYLPLTIQYYGMDFAQFNVSFTSNSNSFTKVTITASSNSMGIEYKVTNGLMVYSTGQSPNWLDNAYKTITFTSSVTGGGIDPYGTEEDLIEWLEANATLVKDEVEISYKGSVIASMNASGTKTLETAGMYCEGDIEVEYTRPSAPTPTLQSKSVSYTPATSQQTASVTADAGYDGLSAVNVTVNAMPSGTAGTPTATKGTVSNNSVSVTPSVTNSTGYITGGTKTGIPVTVTASELVSGTKNITSSGTTDVTNYASASVAAGSATTPATTITANPTITVSASGLITASVSKTQGVTPTVSAGYVASGTSGTITVNGSNTNQLTVYNGAHHAVSSGYTVTVSLTNPINDDMFEDCKILDLTDLVYIGQIASPTGNTTISVDAGHDIEIQFYGVSVSIDPSRVSCTAGITMTSHQWSGPLEFSIASSGTITIDGVDYDD